MLPMSWPWADRATAISNFLFCIGQPNVERVTFISRPLMERTLSLLAVVDICKPSRGLQALDKLCHQQLVWATQMANQLTV